MEIVETTNIPVEQLDALEQYAYTSLGPELRDVLLSLSRCVRSGAELTVTAGSVVLTPSQAAERLGMSRTHLYKLLDRGEVMSYRVGRDRRILGLAGTRERPRRVRVDKGPRKAHGRAGELRRSDPA